MNSRTLIALLAALAILLALAVAVSVSQRPAETGGGLFLPDFKAGINDIDRIVVRTGGDKTVATMTRGKAGWTLAERNDHPADVGRIRKNLLALADARMLEEKTSSAELYDRLKVEDIAKPEAGGVQLDLGAGEKTVSVIVGSTGVGGGDRAYARRPGEAKSWLISGAFDLPRETNDWLDRSLTDIDPARVHAVTITHPGAAPVRVEKAAPGALDFTVANVPAGRELAYPSVGNSIGAALSDLTHDGAEPAAGFEPGDSKPIVSRFETFDGLVVELKTYRLPAGLRVRFGAAADAALAERFAPKPGEPAPAARTPEGGEPAATPAEEAAATDADRAAASAAEAATGEPAAPDGAGTGATGAARKSFAEVQAEAASLNERLGNWVYTLPDFKAEQLTKKLEDLLQPK
jgi:hypothetical protein